MGNIVLLDESTINKIAAGEVIERPASVIKEMVENSIDAGAKNITVEIKNGGISLIKIIDDGCGIEEDDMEIAFERHATSKIRTSDDLETVKSMGFRGEALASIAAIANIEMVSRTANSETGHKIVIEGGKVLEKSEVGCPVGTTITVQNLFYNTPVRYKFLKKDFTEAGYIEDAITRIALINKDISIKLINTGKPVIQTTGNGDFKTTIYNIYGKDVAEGIIEVSYEYEDIKVAGVIGKPEIARSNRMNQIFFVNGRYIRDKNLTAAAEQAYKGMIPIGRYGFLILNLEMDNAQVDVNVHPAKLEVRFQDEGKVFKSVYHTIKSGFGKAELVENIVKSDIEKSKEKLEKPIEEKKSEYVESIYNFRKEMKDIGVTPTPIVPIEDILKNNVNNVTNSDSKEMKFGNTIISSDTQELEVVETSAEAQDDNISVKENMDKYKTQIVDIKKHEKVDDTMPLNEEQIAALPQDTVEISREEDGIKTNTDKTEEENVNKFDEITEKLVKVKMELENTQIIDTSKVREALQEEIVANPEFEEMYKKTFGIEPIAIRKEKELVNLENEKLNVSSDFLYAETVNMAVLEEKEEHDIPKYKFIGISFNTYIIIEVKDEMYIIDQHAAHERIMYEKVKENYYNNELKDSQFLLLPDIVTLTHKEMDIAKENREMFANAGFEFEEFGETSIKLLSVPSMCEDMNTKQLFLDVLDEVDTVAVTARQEKEEKFISTIACKAAVKANMKLDEQEVDNLMKELLKLENPFTCPHGRPTAIKMTKTDMEKRFSRR